MRILKLLSNSIIVVFTIILISIGSIWYGITTNSGTKLLAKIIVISLNSKSNNIKNYKISGRLINKIKIQDLDYSYTPNHHNPETKYSLHLTAATIQINWLELFKTSCIPVTINISSGTLNNAPLNSELNFLIHFMEQKKYYLKLAATNFLKIGNNLLTLNQITNSNSINFNLTAKQLELIDNQIHGNLLITGQITDDLTKLSAKINTTKLMVNNIELSPILQNKNNSLAINVNNNNQENSIEFNIDFKDIGYLMKFIPSITRLKGKLEGSIKFINNKSVINKPKITTNLNLHNVTMSLPEYGVKIKPLFISLHANNQRTIAISGKGVMRNGPGEFNLKGTLQPFSSNFDNSLAIYGDNIECVNTHSYHIFTSLNLNLSFLPAQNALKITGAITMPKGTINLDKQNPSTLVKSKDIIFVEQHISNYQTILNKKNQNDLQILPDLELRIEPDTKLLGKGLDTFISGKLKIYTDQNKALLGDGRISIKHGTYTLSGQEFVIEKGRFIYLPGTLIANPTLDIKILPKQNLNSGQINEQFLYIEGNLNTPIIKDNGLINEHQAILQLLNFGNQALITGIKNKLHLEEIGIQEDRSPFKYTSKPIDSLFANKNFVIGKKINNKMHVQYLKTLNDTNNTIRLNYKLNPSWSLGIESSTETGHGVDLGFFIEK